MYSLPQFRDQGHASLCIEHDLVPLLRLVMALLIFMHNLMPNIVSDLPDFKIFWGDGEYPQTPEQKWPCGPLSTPSPTLLKLAAHFKLY